MSPIGVRPGHHRLKQARKVAATLLTNTMAPSERTCSARRRRRLPSNNEIASETKKVPTSVTVSSAATMATTNRSPTPL
jgi:hypothetical protein